MIMVYGIPFHQVKSVETEFLFIPDPNSKKFELIRKTPTLCLTLTLE